MHASESPEQRTALLEFVDRHWRELTLGDARALSLEHVQLLTRLADTLNKPLALG